MPMDQHRQRGHGEAPASPASSSPPLENQPPRPTVCFWLIGNPVSGQGKGASMMRGIAGELIDHLGEERVRTLTTAEFFSAFGAGSQHGASSPASLATLQAAVHEMNPKPFTPSLSSPTHEDGQGGWTGSGGNVCAFLVPTQQAKDGVRVARAVAAMNCHTRWRTRTGASGSAPISSSSALPSSPTRAMASDRWLHVVGVVGGDGSLSDVVNGLCWGTLAAYRSLCTPHIRQEHNEGEESEAQAPRERRTASGEENPPPTAAAAAAADGGGGGPSCLVSLSSSSPVQRGPGIATSLSMKERNLTRAPAPRVSLEEVGGSRGATPPEAGVVAVVVSALPGEVAASATVDEEDAVAQSVREAAKSCLPVHLQQQQQQQCDSHHYYWRLANDKSVLRNFLPAVLYTPGGTGADFAKLRLCCATAKEAVAVLTGVIQDFFTGNATVNEGEGHGTATTGGGRGEGDARETGGSTGSNCCGANGTDASPARRRFLSYEVDVGRVTFPKTGHSSFFINECSIGMSCDVVERGEHLKRNRLMSALGGRLLFASSAAISLLLMAPKNIRVARLEPMPWPPSARGSGERVGSEKGDHTRNPLPPPLPNGFHEHCHTAQLTEGRVVAEAHLPPHLRDSALAWDAVKLDEVFLLEQQRWQQQQPGTAQSQLYEDYYRFLAPTQHQHSSHPRRQRHSTRTTPFYAMPDEADLVHLSSKEDGGASLPVRDPVFCDDAAAMQRMLDLPRHPSHRSDPYGNGEGLLFDGSTCPQSGGEGRLRWVYCESSTWAFGNGRWYGGGMHVTPHGNPTDGLLSCTNWVATVLPFVSGVFSLYTGGHVKWRSTTALDGERFVVDVGPLSGKAMAKQKAVRAKQRARAQERPPSEPGSGRGEMGDSHNAADWDDDERLVMLMEADGELLEELPAVVELGGVVTLLAPSTDTLEQWRACFGPPAPGTTRARIAEEDFRQLSAGQVSLKSSVLTRDEAAPSIAEEAEEVEEVENNDGSPCVAVTVQPCHGEGDEEVIAAVECGGERQTKGQAGGWFTRGWRSMKRWLSL